MVSRPTRREMQLRLMVRYRYKENGVLNYAEAGPFLRMGGYLVGRLTTE